MDIPINYMAVIGAAISNMVLGFLWYGPLFGKQWMHLMGFTHESMDAFLMAYVFAHAYLFGSTYLNTYGVASGMMAAFWNWLGFIAPVTVGSVIWDGKPWKLWCINAGYYLVALLLMGVIMGIWS
jgi:hypothetical protein